MKRAYVTNNASRSPNAIAAQLSAMGVPATAADIVTSAQAAAHVLADRLPAGSPVLVVGGTGLRLALRARGLRPVSTAADKPLAVVAGLLARHQLRAAGRGGAGAQRGRLLCRLERRPDAADAARRRSPATARWSRCW